MPILPFIPKPESSSSTNQVAPGLLGLPEPELPFGFIPDGSISPHQSLRTSPGFSGYPSSPGDSTANLHYAPYPHRSRWEDRQEHMQQQFAAFTERQRRQRRLVESVEVNSHPLPSPLEPSSYYLNISDLRDDENMIAARPDRASSANQEIQSGQQRQRFLNSQSLPYRQRIPPGFADLRDPNPLPAPSYGEQSNGFPNSPQAAVDSRLTRDFPPSQILPATSTRRETETPLSLLAIRREGRAMTYTSRTPPPPTRATPSQRYRNDRIVLESDDENGEVEEDSDSSMPPLISMTDSGYITGNRTIGDAHTSMRRTNQRSEQNHNTYLS